jgi:hypothetical protein
MSTCGRSSIGIVTHSKAPNRVIEYADGADHVVFTRTQRDGYYVAMMVLPDGRVSASSTTHRKDAILANAAASGMTRRSTTARTSKEIDDGRFNKRAGRQPDVDAIAQSQTGVDEATDAAF